jgi:pyrimidine-nucleoside phosphorylase
MRAVDVIRKKRDGGQLTQAEIEAFVHAATHGGWERYQLSALLMAIVLRGMTEDETAHLTRAMVASGTTLDWSDIPGPKVDKHSTGGVGDKTSLILAPLAVACGAKVPMMSGRGLGHTGGTLDKLESIPGFRVDLNELELRMALLSVGMGMIGQTAEVAPADKQLYALRDVTATVESIPLIASSIMSKKLAEGIDALVMDVKCGRGAFMKSRDDARRLAETIVDIGRRSGVRTMAFITSMEEPLGRAIGNSLEVIECLETLKGRGPQDLEQLSVILAAGMLYLADLAKTRSESEQRVREALTSGQALDVMRQCIAQQGGNPKVCDDYSLLPAAPRRTEFRAPRSGFVTKLDAELLGRACMTLGAGRERVEDTVDHAVGAVLMAKEGTEVVSGQVLMEIHYRDETRLHRAWSLFHDAVGIGDAPPPRVPLILETIE